MFLLSPFCCINTTTAAWTVNQLLEERTILNYALDMERSQTLGKHTGQKTKMLWTTFGLLRTWKWRFLLCRTSPNGIWVDYELRFFLQILLPKVSKSDFFSFPWWKTKQNQDERPTTICPAKSFLEWRFASFAKIHHNYNVCIWWWKTISKTLTYI